MGTLSISNWNLEMLVFEEREKPENQSKDENQQQTQPTYGVKYEIGKKVKCSNSIEHFIFKIFLANGGKLVESECNFWENPTD